MSVPYQTPEEHLERLLGRALNSFELPDETIRRLETALAYDSSLRSAHHSGGLHRETYRHTFLLADGEALTLWELRHNAAPYGKGHVVAALADETQHELYPEEEEARIAAARIAARAGRGCAECAECASTGEFAEFGEFGGHCSGGCCDPLPFEPPTAALPALPSLPSQRAYAAEESADHARRLLRRAENPDRPGAETAALLRSAAAHQITQSFGHPGWSTGPGRLGFALYEHAFLLSDGREISLWEVEHTDTPDGRHMCEVYLSEDAARAAMERRAIRTGDRR
ncbi:DUF6227 family protein [Streptomyces sp. NPDC002851]